MSFLRIPNCALAGYEGMRLIDGARGMGYGLMKSS